MKKKTLLTALVVLLVLIWYFLPTSFLKLSDGEQVAVIEVFNATNGHRFTVTDGENVSYIAAQIQERSFRKGELSLFVKGSLYHLTFLDETGKELETLIVNSDKWIRKDPFSYSTVGDMEILDSLRMLEETANILGKD